MSSLGRGPLPQDEVIDYMAQAARGLAHAHEKGVIHRDIKPTNLFLANSGIVKVLDLGFGELIGMEGKAGNVFDTDEGIVVGTTDFMSPEQVRNKPIDPRTDLFSLGCTMYRLLTGTYAFPGLTREDRLAKRIRDGHVPITEVRADLSYRLAAIVDRLLALRPDDRFGSAAEVAEALEALIPPAGGSARHQREIRCEKKARFRRSHASRGAGGGRLVDDRIGPSPSKAWPRRCAVALWSGTSPNRLLPGESLPIARPWKVRASNPGGTSTKNTARK